jgi:predicted metal-dependent peptidase
VRWNRACDYAINPLVTDAGLVLPKGVLLENRFRGMSAERIYNLLIEEEGADGDGPGDAGANDAGSTAEDASAPVTPGGIGQVLDAPEPEHAGGKTPEEQRRDWQIAVEQAETISKLAGKIPAGLDRCLEGAEQARVDWRELLRRSISQAASITDYSWMRPNRRHIWQGLYLPGVLREGVGEVVIAVDCSGSVSARQLALFEAEIQSILDGQRPDRVHVLYFDTIVHKVDEYRAGEPITLAPVGGGGTDFCPCFEWIEENGARPEMVVFLTDLYGTLPALMPAYDVVWASTGAREAPFGQVVPMQAA